MAKKEKRVQKKGKKIRKGRKHESVKIWKNYNVKGNVIERKGNFCPRCGPGVWLSNQKDRLYCGKCGYTDFKGTDKKEGEKTKEGPTEEVKEVGETKEGIIGEIKGEEIREGSEGKVSEREEERRS
jgi:small subunit ribosomal protein S27Ae